MDPKMDSGLMKPGEEDSVYDVLQPKLPEEIIGIIDQLFSSEVNMIQKNIYISRDGIKTDSVSIRCHGITAVPCHRQFFLVYT